MITLATLVIFVDMFADPDVRAVFPVVVETPISVGGLKRIINQKIVKFVPAAISDYHLSSIELRQSDIAATCCLPTQSPSMTNDMIIYRCGRNETPINPAYARVVKMLPNGSSVIATRLVDYIRITAYDNPRP